ncbi:MAG TPA: hypothetical protein VK553_08795 [Candidatus Nitrosopolaris rasttigaisensis]|nr:hypothetical protein [Candidatus Nitrosopolaris rasttigaisensis]
MGTNSLASTNTSDSGMCIRYHSKLERLNKTFDRKSRWPNLYFSSWSEAQAWVEVQLVTGSIPEHILAGSSSDIAQQVQLVMSKPHKKTNLFRMAGVIKEPFSSDSDE